MAAAGQVWPEFDRRRPKVAPKSAEFNQAGPCGSKLAQTRSISGESWRFANNCKGATHLGIVSGASGVGGGGQSRDDLAVDSGDHFRRPTPSWMRCPQGSTRRHRKQRAQLVFDPRSIPGRTGAHPVSIWGRCGADPGLTFSTYSHSDPPPACRQTCRLRRDHMPLKCTRPARFCFDELFF